MEKTNVKRNVSKSLRFRKKPVVIEAVRWTGANIEEVLPFFGDFSKLPRAPDDPHVHVGIGHCPPEGTLDIPTLEGTMTARAGDWIIKGVKGEFYPCKPDIFAATYEEAEGSENAPSSEPTIDMLRVIVYGQKWPEDWEAGKQAQIGGKPIPFKTEYEQAYGFYKRIIAGKLPSERTLPSVDESACHHESLRRHCNICTPR